MTDTHTKPSLVGRRVTLRAAKAGDEEYLVSAGRHAEIVKMYGEDNPKDGPVPQAEADAFLNLQLKSRFAWVIEHEDALIGSLSFHSVDRVDQRAMMATGLFSPDNFNKGLGSEAMSLVLGHAFGAMNLHRVSLRVLHFNARAIAAYQKLGFVIEGRERQSARIGSEWHDDIIMGLLAPEFNQKRAV
jgi:RimJ/RimL family protein N-acetyltransferase